VDEFSTRSFLNAFLIKVHRQPVSLERSDFAEQSRRAKQTPR